MPGDEHEELVHTALTAVTAVAESAPGLRFTAGRARTRVEEIAE